MLVPAGGGTGGAGPSSAAQGPLSPTLCAGKGKAPAVPCQGRAGPAPPWVLPARSGRPAGRARLVPSVQRAEPGPGPPRTLRRDPACRGRAEARARPGPSVSGQRCASWQRAGGHGLKSGTRAGPSSARQPRSRRTARRSRVLPGWVMVQRCGSCACSRAPAPLPGWEDAVRRAGEKESGGSRRGPGGVPQTSSHSSVSPCPPRCPGSATHRLRGASGCLSQRENPCRDNLRGRDVHPAPRVTSVEGSRSFQMPRALT